MTTQMALNSPTWGSLIKKSRAIAFHGVSGTGKGYNSLLYFLLDAFAQEYFSQFFTN